MVTCLGCATHQAGWSAAVAAAAAPLPGNYTPDLGRTPMAAKDPTLLNAAQGAGYELKEGDKPFQQQEKKGWFPW